MRLSDDKKGKGTMAHKATYSYINEVLAIFDSTTNETLEEASASEHALYKEWRVEGGLDEREVQLHKVTELLRHDANKYAEVTIRGMRKLFIEARGEMGLCIKVADYCADKAEGLLKPHLLENTDGDAHYIK